MKKLLILLLAVMASVSSCAIHQEKEAVKESGSTSFQPEPLADEWSQWLIGKWRVTGGGTEFLGDDLDDLNEPDEGVVAGFIIESVLNGQFIMMKPWAEAGDAPDEQTQYFDDE